MKKIIAAIMLCVLLCGCGIISDARILEISDSGIPGGYASAEEHFDPAGFQDYTDYCKFIYPEGSTEKFAAKGYSEVTENDLENLAGYFENFSGWMDAEDRSDEFDFDPFCISEGDYYLIDSMEGTPIGQAEYGKYDNYTVYFFDTETDTLYYVHTNI